MSRNDEMTDGLAGIRLPVITGPTLAPAKHGLAAFGRMMCRLYPVLPNRAALLEKRLRPDCGPVPVRFTMD